MKAETFENVFDALVDCPTEAANMTARADLLVAIRERVRGWKLKREDAAGRLGLTRPRLDDLIRGKVEKFSLDVLVDIATKAGLTLRIEVVDAA